MSCLVVGDKYKRKLLRGVKHHHDELNFHTFHLKCRERGWIQTKRGLNRSWFVIRFLSTDLQRVQTLSSVSPLVAVCHFLRVESLYLSVVFFTGHQMEWKQRFEADPERLHQQVRHFSLYFMLVSMIKSVRRGDISCTVRSHLLKLWGICPFFMGHWYDDCMSLKCIIENVLPKDVQFPHSAFGLQS